MPGIIITGYADAARSPPAGRRSVVLTKPFTLDQMKAAIGAVGNPIREPAATL